MSRPRGRKINIKKPPSHLRLCIFCMTLFSGCQVDIVDEARQASGTVAASIANLPATILPVHFNKAAYIDSDFSIPNAVIESDADFTVIRSFFSTNRSSNPVAEHIAGFGQRRTTGATFGKTYTIVRRDGASFNIEPDSLINVNIGEPPKNRLTLGHNEIQEREDFVRNVIALISRSENFSGLLYIHGFNVSFEEAANNTAKLSYDLGFTGQPFFFSWPARGSVPSYTADREDMKSSQPALRSMIRDILTLTPITQLYIVAEGMGAALVSHALKNTFATHPEFRQRISEIVLIAPDIDRTEFIDELAPFIASAERPVTLYASNDYPGLNFQKQLGERVLQTVNESSGLRAIEAAETRSLAGDTENGPLVVNHVETIDMGVANTPLSEAQGFADPGAILEDLWDLINNGNRANSRSQLTACYSPDGTHWAFAPDRFGTPDTCQR